MNMITDAIYENKEYVIYGAQVVAVGACVAIEHLTGIRPKFFVVGKSNGKTTYPVGNPQEIDGIPVISIEKLPKDTFIVVGVTELVQKEVLPFLKRNGYYNIFPLTQREEHILMSEYYEKIGKFCTIDLCKQEKFVLYEVMNHKDKKLDYPPRLFYYECPIQAGAALTDLSLCDVKDNTGINISEQNLMYCEMSAVYWIWKNTNHEWVGIEHYRRHLLVSPEMLNDEVDVIMPLPYICYPNEMSQFLRFVSESVLDVLLKTLKELHSDKYDDYYAIMHGKYQYTYNMLCARRKVFDEYCEWFFEITEYMVDKYGDVMPELKETRALSYVAEVLTNLYFMYHQKDLNIYHVGKEIYT